MPGHSDTLRGASTTAAAELIEGERGLRRSAALATIRFVVDTGTRPS